VGAGKSIQSQEGTEGCLTKADGKAAADRERPLQLQRIQ
jgi:hypothetical protein